MNPQHSPAEPIHTVELDGQQYRVRYDFNALAVFHEITGVNLLHGWDVMKFGPNEVTAFLFCGLMSHKPDVQYKWCAEQLTLDNYQQIMERLRPALTSAMPEPKGDQVQEGNASAQRSIGKPSGFQPASISDLPMTSSTA